jgi:hypothetical protein
MTATDPAIDAQLKNLVRYCQLLATDLTDQEREFIHRRIAETRLAIEQLENAIVMKRPEAEAA